MTSMSTSMGAVPLLLWEGAGTQSRFAIGIVIFAGVIFSTALTLFVVPAFYNLLAPFTRSPGAIAAEMADWERRNRDVDAGDEVHAANRSLRGTLLGKSRAHPGE
jgi:multidrug efflux pump